MLFVSVWESNSFESRKKTEVSQREYWFHSELFTTIGLLQRISNKLFVSQFKYIVRWISRYVAHYIAKVNFPVD